MAQPCFSNHRPGSIPLIYDLGAHMLTIEDQGGTLTEKGDAETVIQEVRLDSEEMYKLLVTLQALFA